MGGVTAILLTNALPTLGALVFMLLWLAVVLSHGRASLAVLLSAPFAWAYPVFLVASTLWSVAPGASLRYGLEDAVTVGCALLAARLQHPRALVSALALAMLAVAAASVALGTSNVDPLTGASSFVGLFGSKNQVGLLSTMMLLASLALVLDPPAGLAARLAGAVGVAATAPLLYVSKSATSIVTAALAVLILLANLRLSRLDRRTRPRVLFAMAVSLLPLAALFGFADDVAGDFVVNVMGKDTTLTGRTMLWRHAAQLIPYHPLGGVGAGAFWLQDTTEAEGLWREFHVDARAGFHFHNTYIEAAIELGYAGCALLIATIAGTWLRCLRWSWSDGSVMASLFVSMISCLIIRSFVEIDVLQPFTLGTFLLFAAGACATAQLRSRRA